MLGKYLRKIFRKSRIAPFQAIKAQSPQLHFNYGIILGNTENICKPTNITSQCWYLGKNTTVLYIL